MPFGEKNPEINRLKVQSLTKTIYFKKELISHTFNEASQLASTQKGTCSVTKQRKTRLKMSRTDLQPLNKVCQKYLVPEMGFSRQISRFLSPPHRKQILWGKKRNRYFLCEKLGATQ